MQINVFPWRHCIIALILLALPAIVRAQFIFTTNNGAITITGYDGPGGAVVIPGTTNGYTVTAIGELAFEDCTNLMSVTIPSSVTNIGLGPFLGCTSLTNISVNPGNLWYSNDTNGVLFDEEQDTLIAYPGGLTNSTYSIPSSVSSVGAYAFASCSGLTLMSIPYNVTTIGEFAFSQCTGLASVTMNDSLPRLTNVGVAAFSFCTSLASVSMWVTNNSNIGGLAFAFCTNLTSAYLYVNAPPDVGTAFYGDPDAVVYYLPGAPGWGATFGGAPTVEETFPSEFEYTTNDGTITITGFFGGGTTVIPRTINGYVVTSIGEWAFENGNVYSVTVPNSVTNIGEGAFDHCLNLKSVTIPNSVIAIGVNAFYNCPSLTGITIPNSVTSIGDSAFAFCSKLTSAYFEGNAPANGYAFDGDGAATVYYLPGTTGWGVTFGGIPTELWNPQATSFAAAGNQFDFNITGPSNATIIVEACTNLAGPIWIPVSTNVLTGGRSPFSDPSRAGQPSRFYRFAAP